MNQMFKINKANESIGDYNVISCCKDNTFFYLTMNMGVLFIPLPKNIETQDFASLHFVSYQLIAKC